MYALNIDAETGRILSATYLQYASENAIIVDALPEGDITDYLYQNGEYIYSPLLTPEITETPQPTNEELQAQIDALTITLLEGGSSNA